MNNPSRIFKLKNSDVNGSCVVYWMSREQRVNSNFGLALAQRLANKNIQKLFVVFTLADGFLGAGLRQYTFMFNGLMEVEAQLKLLNIPFVMLIGNPPEIMNNFCTKIGVQSIVVDFDPLRIKQSWQAQFCGKFDGSVYEVDGHNIVPCRIASQKQEFGAYTIRPKIKKLIDYFLEQSADTKIHQFNQDSDFIINDFALAIDSLKCNKSVLPISWIQSGESAANNKLKDFLASKLNGYSANRNDPNKKSCSDLSIYLHFGQIYAGDIARAVINSRASSDDKDAFLEEITVRKELSDNFCFYNQNYDNFDAFPNWAKNSFIEHEGDLREYLYSVEEFENAKTHDKLWNASQNELKITGKIHGYMRMYWAKKILEWTPNPKIAQETAIYLNDKYALDGRDPNGYVGIAWSIGGVHDRAWFNRNIFGKIRYMNANGAKSKFDTNAYILEWV